jgi:hypothetical protein
MASTPTRCGCGMTLTPEQKRLSWLWAADTVVAQATYLGSDNVAVHYVLNTIVPHLRKRGTNAGRKKVKA